MHVWGRGTLVTIEFEKDARMRAGNVNRASYLSLLATCYMAKWGLIETGGAIPAIWQVVRVRGLLKKEKSCIPLPN